MNGFFSDSLGDRAGATDTLTASGRRYRPDAGVELGRYTASAGERILYGRRGHGVVRITDVPAQGHGRAYLVEREPRRCGQPVA